MMGLTDRVLENLKDRRQNLLEGNINCIPFPFSRFRNDVPGIEKGRYISITGATKSSKTQLASYLYVFYPILYSYRNPDKVHVKIIYYPMEETPEQIMTKFMSFLLYHLSKGKYRISPTDLASTNNDKPLSENVLNILHSEDYQNILKYFEECVIFSNSTNPTGVWKQCKKYAEETGKIHTKEAKYVDEFGQTQTTTEAFDWYEPNDPKLYNIIFFDHISLVNTEGGKSLRETMQKLSEYFVVLRNRYKFTIVILHQQAMFEDTDNFKLKMLTPSIATLADNKGISRDVDLCLSVFSPYKYGLPDWKNYDIKLLKDNIRFMECLLNRHGLSNGILPLYFDGACNYFSQMPIYSDAKGMAQVEQKLNQIRTQKGETVFLIYKTKQQTKDNGNHFTHRKERG